MNFDRNRYKVITWKNWMMLHWILNPAVAINELVLGQRTPKVSLIDKTVQKPLMERTFIPCPHCDTLHDGRVWSTQNKTIFRNWFGMYCKQCGQIIPCLTNVFSFIILALTFPIWGWFRKGLKKKWLKNQPKRYEDLDTKLAPGLINHKDALELGLKWGAFMFIVMSIGFPYFTNLEMTWQTLLMGLGVWTIAGLVFGFSMKLILNKIAIKKPKNPPFQHPNS